MPVKARVALGGFTSEICRVDEGGRILAALREVTQNAKALQALLIEAASWLWLALRVGRSRLCDPEGHNSAQWLSGSTAGVTAFAAAARLAIRRVAAISARRAFFWPDWQRSKAAHRSAWALATRTAYLDTKVVRA